MFFFLFLKGEPIEDHFYRWDYNNDIDIQIAIKMVLNRKKRTYNKMQKNMNNSV